LEVIKMLFNNRTDAGQQLASKLMAYANRPNLLVLALPRGGIPIGVEVSKALNAPLDIFLVRKLGVPGHEELAMGAIATGGIRIINKNVVEYLDIPLEVIEIVAERESVELQRRELAFRGNRPAPEINGRTVILVDDGLATGSTMRAAVAALREQNPAGIVVGVPTASPSTCNELKEEVDDIICAITPEPFHAVGIWYEDFSQITDEEVHELLKETAFKQAATGQR
jgi:putative phosphoribosyl transferase